jgi:hypothetical protein
MEQTLMIGVFVKADVISANRLDPLIWGTNGFVRKFKDESQFGHDIKLILLEFLVDSAFSLGVPNRIVMGRITKTRAIGVKIPLSSDLQYLSVGKLKELLIGKMLEAIDLLEGRYGGKTDVDFRRLKASVAEAWSEVVEPTSETGSTPAT